MFTTKTKMLFNQLPGMMVYDNEQEIWTRATNWLGDRFQPSPDADNTAYLTARALTFLRSFPEHLRMGYTSLEPANCTIEQPRQVNLRVFPRLFECLTCRRAKSFRDQESGNPPSYTRGFYCANCENSTRFRQWNLMFTHQCGIVAAPQLSRCPNDAHKYEHLYLSILGGQRAGDISVKCMGPDGTWQDPKCNLVNEDLMPDPAAHTRSGCPTATRLKRDFDKVPEAQELAKHLLERGPQIKTVKDPINYRTIGLDLVAPNVQVPPNIDNNESALRDLQNAHLEGRKLGQADFHRIVEGGTGESPRTKQLERALQVFQDTGNDPDLTPALRSKFWKMGNANGAISDYPDSPDAALAELQRLKNRGAGIGSLWPDRPFEDRRHLADQLVEISHLNSSTSGFVGLDQTLMNLQERGRPFAPDFENGARALRRMLFDDVMLSEKFNIVRLQVGYTRASYDPELSILNPYTTPADSRIRFYGRQSQTEAILFKLDPCKLVQWVHEILPTADFQRLTPEALKRRPDCLEWLITNCDYSTFGSIEPVTHQPSAAVYEALHTMSHAFMKTCASFTGIDEANIKELIFPGLPGFVLYKSQHGDFNLGGFVSLYEQHLQDWVQRAIRQITHCHNDPICRNAKMRDNVQAAACYGCLTGSEHGCAHYNRNLDRAMLISSSPQRAGLPITGIWKWGKCLEN